MGSFHSAYMAGTSSVCALEKANSVALRKMQERYAYSSPFPEELSDMLFVLDLPYLKK